MNTIQPMDWSATAAWIALVISIVGTVVGPIITTLLTNRHQIKLRKLEIEEKQLDEYNRARTQAFENFFSYVGKSISDPIRENIAECGKYYFQIYAYVPSDLWEQLDHLYKQITYNDWNAAINEFILIKEQLILSLKGQSPEHP